MNMQTCLPEVTLDGVFGGAVRANLTKLLQAFETGESGMFQALNGHVGSPAQREAMDRAFAHYWPGRDALIKEMKRLVGGNTKK